MIPIYNGRLFYFPLDIHAVYDATGERYLTMRNINAERCLVAQIILRERTGVS